MFHQRHRTTLVAALAGLILPILCARTDAATHVTTIYPTGLFPDDEHHVQAAINGGGTVLLKAADAAGTPIAFNFGPPTPASNGGVNLTTDVELVGERVGGNMTTIAGGFGAIIGVAPVKSRIANIDFESPGATAIVLLASTGTEITGNIVNNVVPVLLTFGFTDGDGIDLFGNDDPANAITGKALISGNLIENLTADFANGTQLDEVTADVEITDNTVVFPQNNGFIQVVGLEAFRSHGNVTISRNSIYMGPGSTNSFPAPIFVGGDHEARYTIANNDIVVDHPNGDGIELNGGDASEPTYAANVSGNRVLINSTYPGLGGAGVSLYGSVNGTVISGNVIEGSSAFALQVAQGFVGGEPSNANRLLGNDISGHTVLTADIYLDSNTSNTLVAGRCTTSINLGVNNRINCGSSGHAAGLGALAPVSRNVLRGAVTQIHEELIARMKLRVKH